VTRLVLEAERRGAAIQQQLHAFDPRVIEIYDYGDRDDCFFVAMQYVAGENVAEILRRERHLDPRRSARIALDVCRQLERLHSFEASIDGQPAAVVHGDIKPSNIQICADGSMRLLDFGIAKRITQDHNLTRHDFGSPSYCSPERLDRARVDRQADLWSLAVTLYEMVAGTPPYQAESTRRLESLIQSRRPPRALPSSCPRGLKAIISKALAAEPERRYGSAAAFREDLELFLDNRETAAERQTRGAWKVSPTVESSKAAAERVARHIGPVRIAAALGCLLLGMAAFMASSYAWRYHTENERLRNSLDWDMYRAMQEQSKRSSPASGSDRALRASYVAAADRVIEAYRNASTSALEKFDWQRARSVLERALAMDPGDRAARGRLALVRGYQDVVARARSEARLHFTQAAVDWPQAPDPHLGLARLYVYSLADLPRALAEFRAAERLGYALKGREIVQEADAYRFQALRERKQSPARARRDLQTAWSLYKRAGSFPRDWDQSVERVKATSRNFTQRRKGAKNAKWK
jgi:hypothetical protein